MAELNNLPFIQLSTTGIAPEAISKVDESIAKKYRMLPFAINPQDNLLLVAMSDPLNLPAIKFVEQKIDMKVNAYYAVESELNQMIIERYAQNISQDVTKAVASSQQVRAEIAERRDYKSLSGALIQEAPINRIVEQILTLAISSRTSDIHIEPQPAKTRVRYRIDGILREKLVLPTSVHDAVVSRIKILSNLKIDEKRVPQDGRFNFQSNHEEVDLRVSTLPTIHGEKIVMRLLKKGGSVPSLEQLGMSGLALANFKDAIKVPHGIILVTGPTGSGKTTTLYSALDNINTPQVNIMTLEDPVEYQMSGVSQVQVNNKAGLTFSSGLRSFLRQDPDIMMVGEIRDQETAALAVQAALTGHLVFSTLHTNSAAGALPRLLDMGIEPFLLSSSMTLAMAQRVARLLNVKYKEEYVPSQEVLEDIKNVLGRHFTNWCQQNNKQESDIRLYRGASNRPKNESEYQGRIGIFEVMPMSEQIQELVMKRKPGSEIEKVALNSGMLLMKQDGYLKALNGLTTIEEVLRVAEI